MTKVGIVDCGISNLGSMRNAFDFLGIDARVVHRPNELRDCSHIVLPGDGTFPAGMRRLQERGLDQAIRGAATAGKMILGVCLGMQLFSEGGDEFELTRGLALVPGRVVAMRPNDRRLPVPQIGWNRVSFRRTGPLTEGLGEDPVFYFMQSYVYADPAAPIVVGTCDHGGPVAVMIEQDNILGFQFHPEKSQRAGLRLLHNFAHAS